MCGICGLIYTDKKTVIDPSLLNKMNDMLYHRGPDDSGIFLKKNVGLAHRRLSIIDLSSGHQPIYNEDYTIVLVFNGEIYNYLDLYKELVLKGHIFKTKSDTETIIHAYEEYGFECVKRFRGMFAFALYDLKKDIFFIARDRVGKKPLYYYKNKDVFIFASEAKVIVKSGLYTPSVNIPMLDFYISIGYIPGQETLFKDIYKLEAGHFLVFERNTLVFKQYWDINAIEPLHISYSEARLRVKDKLLESIKIRLMSEVPLGVFLSGGLDSSVIVALMSTMLQEPIKTFSVGYRNAPESNELEYAKLISEKFNTQHFEFYLTPEDLFESIDHFLNFTDEPLVESAGIALHKLSKLAKPYATVLLSGEGSDEVFAGYPMYNKMNYLNLAHNIMKFFPWIKNNEFIVNRMPEKILKYLDWSTIPFEKRFRSLSLDVSQNIRKLMYSEYLQGEIKGSFDPYFEHLLLTVSRKTLLQKMLYIDTKSWLSDDILLKADRMTMAASIELRAPFLDHELIELVTALPDSYKLKNGRSKIILRDIVSGLVPDTILSRKKRGFTVPLTSWFRGELWNKARDLLTDPISIKRGYFNTVYINNLFSRIKRGDDLGRRIFSLVVLELWHRKFIK